MHLLLMYSVLCAKKVAISHELLKRSTGALSSPEPLADDEPLWVCTRSLVDLILLD